MIKESEQGLTRNSSLTMSLIAPILIATAGRYPLVLSGVFWRPHVLYRTFWQTSAAYQSSSHSYGCILVKRLRSQARIQIQP